MNETTIHATMAPAKRAKMSYAPPTRMASAATVLTTSPAGISSVTAVPVVGHVVADELDRAVRRVHPVGDGELVAQRPADRLEEPERHHDADPHEEVAGVVPFDAVVDGRADRGPDEGLGHHPADAEERVEAKSQRCWRASHAR